MYACGEYMHDNCLRCIHTELRTVYVAALAAPGSWRCCGQKPLAELKER